MGRAKPVKKGGGGNKGYRPPRQNKSGIGSKNTEQQMKANPFETQINKRKHITLGRPGREEHGHPGLAKSRGLVKRRKTLLKDYLTKSKTNTLVDRRIGERSQNIPEEAKIVRRSAVEKRKQYGKKSIFNLNDDDDDILTHGGRSLDAAGRYEDPRDLSDSEDERLDEEFVSEANFGGFMKRKSVSQEDEEDAPEKSRAEIVAELILASKQRKGKKSAEEAALYEKIHQLDESLKDQSTKSLLEELRIKSKVPPPPVTTQSAYDRSLKELMFEKRGQASERLKTAEEIGEEEKVEIDRQGKECLDNMAKSNSKLYLLRILTEVKPKQICQIEEYLSICSLLYEFTKDNKQYCPEVVGFLQNLLFCFDGNERTNLATAEIKLNLFDIHGSVKFNLLVNTMELIGKFCNLYKELPSAAEIIEPFKVRVESIKQTMEQTGDEEVERLHSVIDETLNAMKIIPKEKNSLKAKRAKPTMLRLYEPEVSEELVAPTKRSKSSKDEGRLAAKVKKETKGAIRELKKDNAFLGRQQRKEESQNDMERSSKVKALMSSLANQEGEYQKLQKKK